MPDVVVVGGGIIGVACAVELAERGASVTLFERAGLAAGASGRNQGWFVQSSDPACAPMSALSLGRYLALVEDSPVAVPFDRESIGHLLFTRSDTAASSMAARARAWAATGVEAERLDPGDVRNVEPALADGVAAAWLLHHGRRIDPSALTIAHALRARMLGVDVHRHTEVRGLTVRRDRVTGVVLDTALVPADVVVVAAGPWSAQLVRAIGVELPVSGSRGWIVELSGGRRWLRHLVEEEDTPIDALHPGDRLAKGDVFPTAGEFAAAGHPAAAVEALLHSTDDGTIVCGASHHPALRAEPDDDGAPRHIVERAISVVPRLAAAPVRAIRWGIRPMSPDGRPLVGWLGEGLYVATGHGAEGILLGGGTAALVGASILGVQPPFDPAPFDPARSAGIGGG